MPAGGFLLSMIPSHTSLLVFTSAALVLLAIPGPAVFYILGRSIGQGSTAGVVSALGIAVGTLFHVAAAGLGLSALLVSSAMAFSVVKYLGAGYLVFLGIQRFRREEVYALSEAVAPVPLRRIFAQGVVVNILNPKTAMFVFAFLPQFVDASRPNVREQILILGLLFAVMGIVSDSLWALFAGTLAHWLRGRSQWTQAPRYVSGGILISLGVLTAFADLGGKKPG